MSAVMGFSFPWGCRSEEPQPRRPRIDRSMIGAPTNFVHAGHIGSGDTPQLGQVKDQMSSKGETAAPAESSESSSSVVANALSLDEARKQFGSKREEEEGEQAATQGESAQQDTQQQEAQKEAAQQQEPQQQQTEEEPSQQQEAQQEDTQQEDTQQDCEQEQQDREQEQQEQQDSA